MTERRAAGLFVEIEGSGPDVVMIHGLGGSSNSFQTLMGALVGFRVLRPDLPGSGRSPYRPGRPGFEGLLSALRDGLRALEVRRCHLVGHSLGALICQHIAASSAVSVQSMTLYGPLIEPSPAARSALSARAAKARSGGMTAVVDSVLDASIAPASRKASPVVEAFVRESLMAQNPNGYAALCEALGSARSAKHASIDCPALLVTGAEDGVAPSAAAAVLQSRIPGSRLEIVPDAGHWVMVEAPGQAAELLRKHLEDAG